MATWILSIVCILCWGTWAITQKMTVRYLPPITSQFVINLWLAFLVPVIYAVMRPMGLSLTWSTPGVLWAGLGSILSTVACIAFLYAVQGSKVYLVTGITSTYPIVTLFIAWMFLSEPITWKSVLGTISIVVGIILLQV